MPEDSPAKPPAATLAAALAAEGIELAADRVALLDAYRQELWDWNERVNLTRHTTLEKFVTRDVVDSLELAKLLGEGEAVLDVGSGGGVPGAILAIVRPDLRVRLTDSVAKKARVLEEIVAAIGLPVAVHAGRAEEALAAERFDALTIRGVAPLWKLAGWFAPHRGRFGRLLIIKGPAWIEERGEARHRGVLKGFDLRREAEYATPRTSAVSTILSLAPRNADAAGGPAPKRSAPKRSAAKRSASKQSAAEHTAAKKAAPQRAATKNARTKPAEPAPKAFPKKPGPKKPGPKKPGPKKLGPKKLGPKKPTAKKPGPK